MKLCSSVDVYLNDRGVKIVCVIFTFFSFFQSNAQDIHFSQLSQTQLYTNPAFSGIQYGPRVLAHYRNQYPQIGSDVNAGLTTYYGSYDQFFDDYNSGVGLQVMMDRMSESLYSRVYLTPTYTYQMTLSHYHALRFGVGAQVVFQQIDRSKLRFYDQIDPVNGFQDFLPTQEDISQINSSTYFNAQLGALYFTHNFYLGGSLRNILPKGNNIEAAREDNFTDLLVSGQMGASWWLNDDNRTAIFPYTLYEYQYGYHKILANFLFQYKMINIGIGVRHNTQLFESFIPMMGLNFNKIRVSYSYDVPANNLSTYSGGSHELGIRYLINGEDNSLKPNAYKNILFCPDFMRN